MEERTTVTHKSTPRARLKALGPIYFLVIAGLVLFAGAAAGGDAQSTTLDDLAYVVELPMAFDEAVERLTEALAAEQFSIVSRVELHTIFKEKLDVKVPPHIILGACNSKLAYKAVTAEPAASLMLPCPVTVQALDDHRTVVRIGDPGMIMDMSGLDQIPAVGEVGKEAHVRLERVAQALEALK